MGHRPRLVILSVVLFANVVFAQLEARSAKFRDASKEDEVAKVFEDARQSAGAKRLTRIRYRDEVQELVCTAALTDRAPLYSTGVPALGGDDKFHPPSALYKTTEPATVTAEIKRLASFDPLQKQGYKRYSVAVWRSANSGEDPAYWIGIQLYWGEAMEFFDYHFTDDISYHNARKKSVVNQCRSR